MASPALLKRLARQHGTPLFVVDHAILRKNLATFRQQLPRVQPYFAVKANSLPEIVRTFYRAGASFDVASIAEFRTVVDNIKDWPPKKQQDFIWDKIIYANPIKDKRTLEELNPYKPLVTYDNLAEVHKIRQYAPDAGLILRLSVPNTGSVVELASKFGAPPGEAVNLIEAAAAAGLTVEGLSFHVGSQCTNFQNYIQALALADSVMKEAWSRGHRQVRILDIGGGFPAPYDAHVRPFRDLARTLRAEFTRLFPPDMEILAEPGRFLVATACTLVAEVIGKADRNGKRCYYINDGVYHTFSGILFDHCKYPVKAFRKGPTQLCAVFGPTCDALDTISLAEPLPELELGDLVYSPNIGAYSHASSTWFNGFPPAQVVHINQ
ncbi:MAG TPA: type III PLP-dependent enzyme [Kiritimatiellia bacterium]|nr:type III PLP-dependent enzyme [Kiritimatiellia bacterium]OQC60246.1 MAG: Lysine/ornithine decarboxylase [Verrucomicrobia bacterium ADurb.Bin018]HOD99990.1 type III PLP-dependent enzyme [Kiritimatiellia bacterium]HOE36872.1 type III PLP-dependent enzyme [Kiritimatiellia bacterium]HOR74930.1 type III PLP-dependent enzyme [Kiritimatiellia bacterium]